MVEETFGNCAGEIIGEDFGVPNLKTPLRSLEIFSAAPKILYWPVDPRPIYITQRFVGNHKGLDIGIPNRTKLYNPLPVRGQIVKLGWDNSGYGIMVGIKNDEYGFYIILAHMDQINPDLRVGNWVDSGAFLGWSDNTGNSTGPHLHLEVRESPNWYYPYPSSCIDPEKLLRWRSEPVPPPPPPPPPPTQAGWYLVRATEELNLYSKQKLKFRVEWPKISKGATIEVTDRKKSATQEWVMLRNGMFTLKRQAKKVYLVKV